MSPTGKCFGVGEEKIEGVLQGRGREDDPGENKAYLYATMKALRFQNPI